MRIGEACSLMGVQGLTTMPTPNTTKADVLIKALGETHAARVARATKELTEAEALLKSGGAKPKRFLATYRIRNPDSPAKGTSAQRREHPVARIKTLQGARWPDRVGRSGGNGKIRVQRKAEAIRRHARALGNKSTRSRPQLSRTNCRLLNRNESTSDFR